MFSKEGLREQFLSMGVRITDVALSKCLELCSTYNLSEDDLLETWMAYAVSNIGDADPTVDMLNQMERKELAKSIGTSATTSQNSSKKSSLMVYNVSLPENTNHSEILQLYSTPTAKRKEDVPKENTPDGSAVKKLVSQGRSPRAVFSPASFSPKVATPSTKYESRTNSGDIVLEHGNCEGASWSARTKFTPVVAHDEVKHQRFRFMFERLQEKADILDDVIHELGQELLQQNNLSEPTNPTVRHAELFVAAGRVCCDANGRLNPTSVLLESEQSFGCGKSVALDLSQLETYSLFPGQIIAIEGVNLDGKKVIVKKLYTDIKPVLADSLPTFSNDDGPLQVVVAAGPYTQTDTLMYQPLEDLVSYIRNHEPHALILVGPFVDAKHPHVEEGKLAETHDSLFEKIVEGIMEPLRGSHTQVVVVPCWRDVHHHVIYPTPPFLRTKRLMYTNLHFMSDPCQFSICGVKFGVTSVDVLFHLGKEEISYPAQGSDRLGRLAGHVLSQRNFYPLFPPAEELSVDLGHWEKLSHLPVAPHILILPSDLRYFIKNIKGCLVVNPERLAKGLVGGSMARLEIKAAGQGSQFPVSVVAQILKI
ncbi:DNA polymerase alpha subunit B isoform X1 [Schistocerca piceifrons]|uniref:DNA polymerase alpha subunit B isoform X1 n=1 Tax=Schistocerca piceifrons TaxID=274613 RepID=UPI001F5E4B12|nr:DNA polymerase alpha subunit B isoform X1 [Schistocerca piceifrons]